MTFGSPFVHNSPFEYVIEDERKVILRLIVMKFLATIKFKQKKLLFLSFVVVRGDIFKFYEFFCL